MTEILACYTFLKVMQYATVGFGFICFTIPLLLGIRFLQSHRPIGKAVAIMLFGECVGIGVTVIFSILDDGVLLDVIGVHGSLVLRLIMFSAAIITSLHLAYQTWVIEISGDK